MGLSGKIGSGANEQQIDYRTTTRPEKMNVL